MPSSFSAHHSKPPTYGVEINDESPSETTTYSGQKIEDELAEIAVLEIDDATPSLSTVYSSQKIEDELALIPLIDDATPSLSTLYSGTKIESLLTGSGIVESEVYFLKGSNTVWYTDELIQLRWDGFDEVFIKHTGAAGIPSDVYATSHVNTNSVSFPSGNGMIVTTVDNDFLQRSSAFFSDFTIRSDSNATAFPYYKVHFEVSGSSGLNYCYWTLKRYPI